MQMQSNLVLPRTSSGRHVHPADQFEAFVGVIPDQGKSVADVAARFSVNESLVTQRLKLGRLAPSILQAYREEVIGLYEAQAFTLTDDHAEQERALRNLAKATATLTASGRR